MTSHTPQRHERGAVSTIVAILLVFGVVMGTLAIAVDVGNLLWERRQLQNAADAAALSLAKSCADGTCSPSVNGLDNLVNANSADSLSGYETTQYPAGQCGKNVAGLPTCYAPTNFVTDCPALPTGMGAAVPYVEVHTKTQSNASTIRQVFAGLIGGNSDNKVAACARVAFGEPGLAQVPVTFSMCEWIYNTDGNGDGVGGDRYYAYDPPYGGTNPYPTPASGIDRTIYLQDHGSSVPCDNFNGHDVPGGFGYLNASSACVAAVGLDSWTQIDTGNSTSCDFSQFWKKTIYLPIFDCVIRSGSLPTGPIPTAPPADVCNQGNGNNTYYHIKGWAKFFLSGYKTGGSQEKASPVTGNVPCSNGDRCLSGWFLDGVLVDGPPSGLGVRPRGNPFGTYTVVPAG